MDNGKARPGRRGVLGLLAAPALLGRPAAAQDFPNRPLRMLVPYPPGGASDVIARLLAQPMTDALGRTVIVENRVGANGSIAAEAVVRSAPDGYTLLMGNAGPNALNQALLGRRLPYDCTTDFTPVSLVSSVPMLIAAHPDAGAGTLPEFLAMARARPGEVAYAHGGTGAMPHLAMEQIGSIAGARWNAVAFRGGQAAMAAVLGAQVPMLIDTAPVIAPQVRDGKLRGVAVTTARRLPQAPDLPTVAEQGFPDFEATSWGGVLGPAGLPEPVLRRLHAAVVTAMSSPAVRDSMLRQGIEPRATTPAAFAEHIAAELQRWTEVVRRADIRPD